MPSRWRETGVAAATGPGDSPALHAEDTLRAGRGLCRPSAVTVLTEEAPARIVDLIDAGVEFDEGLGLEGGHSRRRILHAEGAATGERIARVLAERVLAHPRVDALEGQRVTALWTNGERCVGVATAEGHLAGCAACRGRIGRLDGARQARMVDVPPAVFMARLEERQAREQSRRRPLRFALLLGAPVAAAAVRRRSERMTCSRQPSTSPVATSEAR